MKSRSYLNKADSEGQTLLHHAVKAADPEILQYLLDQGGDVNQVDDEGCSPLHHLAAGPRTPKQGASLLVRIVRMFVFVHASCYANASVFRIISSNNHVLT